MRKKIFSLIVFSLVILPFESLWADPGQTSFQQKCAACHTVGQGSTIGPDLLGVTERRDRTWLVRWIMEPDKMLNEKDPTAMELLKQFNQIPMPNLNVSEAEAQSLLEYIESLGGAHQDPKAAVAGVQSEGAAPSLSASPLEGVGDAQLAALLIFLALTAIIVFVFWQVIRTTRNPVPTIDMKSAYKLRRKFFFGSAVIILGTLVATLPKTPYADDLQTPDRLIYVTAKQFSFMYSFEPITTEEDLQQIAVIDSLELPVGALVEFRVTSLDVNHGFALYSPSRSVVAQTQAMPGYVNRLRIRFSEPGTYHVLCLEYCGLAHHLMRASFTVR